MSLPVSPEIKNGLWGKMDFRVKHRIQIRAGQEFYNKSFSSENVNSFKQNFLQECISFDETVPRDGFSGPGWNFWFKPDTLRVTHLPKTLATSLEVQALFWGVGDSSSSSASECSNHWANNYSGVRLIVFEWCFFLILNFLGTRKPFPTHLYSKYFPYDPERII